LDQNRRFEERCPNGRFLIRKRPLREVPVNDRFWPKADLRERLESTQISHSRPLS
jgi:hypothetical protein